MLKLWSVSMRLKASGGVSGRLFRKLRNHALILFASCEGRGVFTIVEGWLVFVGCRNNLFSYTWGFFPAEFPYDDPFQPVRRGMTREEFSRILREHGFVEKRQERK